MKNKRTLKRLKTLGQRKLISGNEAVVLGALKAEVGFFAGYPITPASEIMHKFSGLKIPFIHCEDEIASINMIIGASMAGKKAMTATSGPGFSLMQESIGYAHMTETPIVIVNSQRVGPSTGMPTLPAQGDVMQAKYGTHGDIWPIVFAPNSVEECYKITIEAFNASEESLSPVTILLDAYLSQMYETLNENSIKTEVKPRVKKALGEGIGHLTGLLSKNGVLKTNDMDYYKEWAENSKKKMLNAAKKYDLFEYIPPATPKRSDGGRGKNPNTKTLVVAYGATSRMILPLKKNYSLFRPIRLFPVSDKIKSIAKNYEKIIVVEMNDGQYAAVLESALKREVKRINILGAENIKL